MQPHALSTRIGYMQYCVLCTAPFDLLRIEQLRRKASHVLLFLPIGPTCTHAIASTFYRFIGFRPLRTHSIFAPRAFRILNLWTCYVDDFLWVRTTMPSYILRHIYIRAYTLSLCPSSRSGDPCYLFFIFFLGLPLLITLLTLQNLGAMIRVHVTDSDHVYECNVTEE